MSKSKLNSQAVIAFPGCVSRAVTAAETLYSFVFSHPFPDLELDVSSPAEAAPIILEALEWAKAVDEAHLAVVRLFPPRETGVEVPVMVPKITRMMLMRRTDGRVVPANEHEEVGPALGTVVQRTLSMDLASDVLEPVPARFQNSLASTFPMAPEDWPHLPAVEHICDHVRGIWEQAGGWDTISPCLHGAMIVVRSKSLGLVGWLRRRVAELESATLPMVTWKSHTKYHGHKVRVSMAGAERTVDLTDTEHRLLLSLASGGGTSSRTIKSNLMQKIPELKPYVMSRGAVSASLSDSHYEVPAEIADRLRVTPQDQD